MFARMRKIRYGLRHDPLRDHHLLHYLLTQFAGRSSFIHETKLLKPAGTRLKDAL